MKIALAHRQRARRNRPRSLETSKLNDLAGLLRAALECIDDGTRAAFVLCDVLQLPSEEVAVILQTSVRAVRRDVHRARRFLRSIIYRL
jgi:DNA-directed RNA polymerase specialized sigma24 family protein